jgi:cold-inducible RNA-binding protein
MGPGGAGNFNAAGKEEVKLYVGNLSFDTPEESIRSMFAEYGTVSDCFMPTDRDTGKVRGFCFVTMPSTDAEGACNKLNGRELDGRPLRVNEAQPRGGSAGGAPRGGGGYSDGGYGGGGGGYSGGGGGGYGGGGGWVVAWLGFLFLLLKVSDSDFCPQFWIEATEAAVVVAVATAAAVADTATEEEEEEVMMIGKLAVVGCLRSFVA